MSDPGLPPHRVSMSKVSLALICPYGFRPDVVPVRREVGLAARLGTAVHLLCEHWLDGREAPVLADELAQDARRIFGQLATWVSARRERLLKWECGVRYDAERDAATWGPRRGEPGYEDVGAMVLPGTLDLVLRGADKVLEVVDVKTGKKENSSVEQLYAQAVAVSRIYREELVRVGFLYPRLTKCDEPEWETLDADRLDEEAGRISKTLRRLPTSTPERGDWCWRCDSREGCPEWQPKVA